MNIGDKAPEILGKDEQGRDIRLSDYKGRKLVLYFYPKDNTSGCTAEACSLRDHYGELQAKGYEVVGVSKDSAQSHQKFKEKYQLPFPLIADVDHTLLEAMGAWGEKSMYGKKVMGTIRTTFVINEEGIIEQIMAGKQIKTKEHAQQILPYCLVWRNPPHFLQGTENFAKFAAQEENLPQAEHSKPLNQIIILNTYGRKTRRY